MQFKILRVWLNRQPGFAFSRWVRGGGVYEAARSLPQLLSYFVEFYGPWNTKADNYYTILCSLNQDPRFNIKQQRTVIFFVSPPMTAISTVHLAFSQIARNEPCERIVGDSCMLTTCGGLSPEFHGSSSRVG